MGFGFVLFAQKDTTQTIIITSTYKPVLRNAVKINFSGSQLPADTNKTVSPYNIPAQNLFYAYQPIPLKPLALQQDTNLYLGTRNFIKAGFGSYSTPYIRAGLGLGDGKKYLFNITGNFISSSAKDIKFQNYYNLNLTGAGSYFMKQHEFYASGSFSKNDYNFYGYDHTVYDYKKKDVVQHLQDLTLKAGVKNTSINAAGINYDPNLEVNFYASVDNVRERTARVNLPLSKIFNKNFSAKLEFNADLTNYGTTGFVPNNISFNNNVIRLQPVVSYHSDALHLNAGITPTWENGSFFVLPNIYGEATLPGETFSLQAGMVGRVIKNTYRQLSMLNPYLLHTNSQFNTRETELYGGIKTTLSKHFNLGAKVGLVTYENLALFINDTATDSKGFLVVSEPKATNLRIHGDLSYINQDKFSLTGSLTLNGYTGVNSNEKAWHTLPMEFSASARYWAFKKLLLKGDVYMFGSTKFIEKGNVGGANDGGSDVNLGAEYRVNRQFSVWLDANNIFNNKYQRWHRYEVYGLNVMGGIIIRF